MSPLKLTLCKVFSLNLENGKSSSANSHLHGLWDVTAIFSPLVITLCISLSICFYLFCWVSGLNSSLMISDNFSPALLTTLKNRHLKAFRGSPATLWLSCCVNRRSLPRGCAPHRWVLVAVLQACHGALHHRSYWLTAWFPLPGVHHLHCLPMQRALHQIACSPPVWGSTRAGRQPRAYVD